MVTEPYRQRETPSLVAKAIVSVIDEYAYDPLHTLTEVAAALAVENAGNFSLSRMEPARPVIEQHTALVHDSYGGKETEVGQLTTRTDDRNLAYTSGPMQFAFSGMHKPRPSVRFDVPYTTYDKATPRHWIRASTPYYACDVATLEEPATEPTTAISGECCVPRCTGRY